MLTTFCRFFRGVLAVLFSAVIFSSPSFADVDFEKLFAEREKSLVVVEYIIQLEEDRRQLSTCGAVYDDNGTIILPSDAFPSDFRLDELKDFKVYVRGGDDEGYEADFIGSQPGFGFYFVRLKKKPADGLFVPYSKFPKAKIAMGDCVWGVFSKGEFYSYQNAAMFERVSVIANLPYEIAVASSAIGSRGSPVFNMNGDFVGLVVGNDIAVYYMRIIAENEPNYTVVLDSKEKAVNIFTVRGLEEYQFPLPTNPRLDKYAWLGVAGIQPLKRDVAKFMGLKEKPAVVISEVFEDSPAQKAGLKKGDIITGIDGKGFRKYDCENVLIEQFDVEIKRKKIGDTMKFDVIDKDSGASREVSAILGESPKSIRNAEAKYFRKFGFSIREFLTDDALARRILKTTEKGALVKYVKPNSPASSALPARLAVGDRIREINSVKIDTYEQARDILSKLESDATVKEIVIVAEVFSETKVVRINLN